MKHKMHALIFCLFIAVNLFAQNGIDPNFGINGVVKHVLTQSYVTNDYVATRLVIDNQNRIIAFGNISINGVPNYCVSRWTINGQLDSSFGINGIVLIPSANTGNCLPPLLMPNGKIVYVGSILINGKRSIVVSQFLENGSLDSSFAVNGRGIFAITYLDDVPIDATCQNDGKIVLVYNNQIYSDYMTVRIKADGVLDSTFNGTGVVKADFLGSNYVKKVLVQNDGKILVAGITRGVSLEKTGLIRYLSNGNLDSSFGVNGSLIQSVGNGNDQLLDIVISNSGKITAYVSANIVSSTGALVQWNANGSINNSFGFTGVKNIGYTGAQLVSDTLGNLYTRSGNSIRKYKANGDLDSTFGSLYSYNFGTQTGGTAISVALTLDNKIILYGTKMNQSLTDLVLAGLNGNGTPLSTFNGNTYKQHTIGLRNALKKYTLNAISSLGLPDGSLLVATRTRLNSVFDLSIFKFLPNGERDTNFGTEGLVVHKFPRSPTGSVNCKMALDANTNIIVAGVAVNDINGSSRDLVLFKIDKSGSFLDFGSNGFITKSSTSNYYLDLKVQNDGKILLLWDNLSRYTTEGILDNTFSLNLTIKSNNPLLLFVLRDNRIIIGNDTGLIRFEPNGSFDPTFGANGSFNQFHIGTCIDQNGKTFHRPRALVYENPGNNLLVATSWYIQCGNAPQYYHDEWIRISENGVKINTIYKMDTAVGNPGMFPLPNYSYFLTSYRTSFSNYLIPYNYFIKKTNPNGSIDESFDTSGINSVDAFEKLTDNRYWYYRSGEDTLRLFNIVIPKTYMVEIKSNKQNIGFGDTVQLSAVSSLPISNYNWRFSSNKFRYISGTDSTSANPKVQFTGTGKYDVFLRADYSDTALFVSNPQFINLDPIFDFVILSPKFLNQPFNIQSTYNGSPTSIHWKISPPVQYLNGTDSNSIRPNIKATQSGKYSVDATINYLDTSIRLFKPNYFEVIYLLGLNQADNSQVLYVFPNPTHGEFYLKSENISETINCKIFDFQGRLMDTLEVIPNMQLPMKLPEQPGIYLLEFSNGLGLYWTTRIVKN